MIRAAAVALLALAAAPVAAQDKPHCAGVLKTTAPDFVAPRLKIVALGRTKRVHFVKGGYEATGCPKAGENCRSRAYLTPGDPVVAFAESGGFVCAVFLGSGAKALETQGFLSIDALAEPPAEDPPGLAGWTGEWRAGPEQRISIKRERRNLRIVGDATWGAGDPRRVANGAVHVGGFEARVAPDGAALGLAIGPDGETLGHDAKEGLCRVKLWRLGPYLVASDNDSCGGANVTFAGVYRRR